MNSNILYEYQMNNMLIGINRLKLDYIDASAV